MRKIAVLAVSGAFVLAANTSMLADSKSAAEFMLKIARSYILSARRSKLVSPVPWKLGPLLSYLVYPIFWQNAAHFSERRSGPQDSRERA